MTDMSPLAAPSSPPPAPLPPRRDVAPFVWLCLGAAAASVLYRVIVLGNVEQTALMFIGLPTALALILALMPRAKSATGMIMKGITLFLLVLGILFIEGFICILMAAPFFYAIGFIVGIFADQARARREFEKRFRLVVLPVLALMSLEGITGALSFPRDESVTVSRWTALAPAAARERVGQVPELALSELPGFLKLGFPTPHGIRGDGLEKGDEWVIHFAGGEGKPGDLKARVVESGPERVVVARVADTSHIAHWLDWQDAAWTFAPEGAGTRVTLIIQYRRLLDPAWYFKPFERYGVRRAGGYFLEQILTKR